MGRKEFMLTTGFALYTDANRPFLEIIGSKPLHKYPIGNSWQFEKPHLAQLASRDQSAAGLFLATYCQKERIPRFSIELLRELRASDVDYTPAWKYTDPGLGFGNLDFTWSIAPNLAVAVADAFVRDGRISQDKRNSFDLYDYAHIIDSKWFGNLVQDASMTAVSVWTALMGDSATYGLDKLKIHVKSRGLSDNIFSTQENVKEDGSSEYSAGFTKTFKHALREKMRESRRPSVGCPVGRKSTVFDRAALLNDPHAMSLVNDKIWKMHERKGDTVRITQERSAIDMTLAHIAQSLREYQNNFGMPYILLDNQNFDGVNWAKGRMSNGLFVAA